MHAVFGKDWNYRLYPAFGHISPEMQQCIEQAARGRAELASGEDGLASTQVDESRFSRRSQARMRGDEPPPVEGVNHTRSVPYVARLEAKDMKKKLDEEDKVAWGEYYRGKRWTTEDQDDHNK